MRKLALVTGATSGIGLETARILARNGYDLLICGRRKERLDALEKELKDRRVYKLSFDVKNRVEVEAAFSSIPADFRNIDVLVNNAGNAHGLDFIQDGSVEDWDAMIDINLKGLLYVSRMVIPGMISRKSGTIINIGSIAGKEVYAKGNVYCASKHGVDAITKGMRIDLNPHGIRVCALNPGLVETEFSEVRFKGDREKARNVYKGIEPLVARDIAELVEFIVTRPPHVTIADVTVFPTAQASGSVIFRT